MCFKAIWNKFNEWRTPEQKEESLIMYPLNTWKRTEAFFDEVMDMKCDCPKCYQSMNTVQGVLDAGPDEHGYLGMKMTTLKCDPCPDCGCITCKMDSKTKKILCTNCGIENGRIAIVAYKSIVECQVVNDMTPCQFCGTTTDFRYDQEKEQFFCEVCDVYINSKPVSGTFKYRLEFDPNNGFIYTKWHEGMEDSIRLWVTDNPNYEKYIKLG